MSRVVRSLASVSTDSAAPRAKHIAHQLNTLAHGGGAGWGQKRTRILRKFQFSVSMELSVSRVVRSLASVSTDSAAPRAEHIAHQLN